MATEDEFHAAVEQVKTLEVDPGTSVKLQLYALYKQATQGDVTGNRPGFTNLAGRAKYDAWAERQGLSAEEARGEYVRLVSSLTE